MPLKTTILLSGGGRSLQNLIDLRAAGQLNIDIPLVVASRPGIGGIDRAASANIPTHVVARKQYTSVQSFSDQIFTLADEANTDLLVMAGWLSLIVVPDRYLNRIINIHPSLLPSFGGKGMFGHHVHEAVLAHGCKVSGCTVHFVDNTYDNGPIILQKTCPVLDADTPDTLARRVFDQECQALPQAISLIAQGRINVQGRRVTLAPTS